MFLETIRTDAYSDPDESATQNEDPIAIELLENILVPEHSDEKIPKKNSLHKLLSSCNEGRCLLLRFQKKGLLDNAARRRLCSAIIDAELKQDPNKRITSTRLHQMAREITEVFKKENSSVYFVPFTTLSSQQKMLAKGKLLDCYRQRRRHFIKSGIVKIKSKEDQCEASSSHNPSTSTRAAVMRLQDYDESVIENKLLWLKNYCNPWETVEQNWAITTKARLNLLKSKELTIQQYYAKYKALNQPRGIYLLLKDHKMLYPENDKKLKQNWLLIRPKIIELAKKRSDAFLKDILKDIEHERNEEVIDLAAFMAIPYLMNTSNVKNLKSKRTWRPSRHEVLKSFITHVKSAAKIEETISQRAQKLHELGMNLQPTIMVVGPSIEQISARYIIVNNIRYEVTSIKNAVDACFKIMFVLKAPYPPECVHVWQFIQLALFELKTKYDKIYTTTNSLLTDLNIPQV